MPKLALRDPVDAVKEEQQAMDIEPKSSGGSSSNAGQEDDNRAAKKSRGMSNQAVNRTSTGQHFTDPEDYVKVANELEDELSRLRQENEKMRTAEARRKALDVLTGLTKSGILKWEQTKKFYEENPEKKPRGFDQRVGRVDELHKLVKEENTDGILAMDSERINDTMFSHAVFSERVDDLLSLEKEKEELEEKARLISQVRGDQTRRLRGLISTARTTSQSRAERLAEISIPESSSASSSSSSSSQAPRPEPEFRQTSIETSGFERARNSIAPRSTFEATRFSLNVNGVGSATALIDSIANDIACLEKDFGTAAPFTLAQPVYVVPLSSSSSKRRKRS